MRINSVGLYQDKRNRQNINFEAVRIKQIAQEYSPLKKVLETELDKFVHKANNAELIGQGLSAQVYVFDKFQEIVFKKSSNTKNTFSDEIKNLKFLPDGLSSVQKFIAQAFDDESGIFYLLSTKMKGKPANPNTNPYTKEHLKNLFETLFELDKNGIYHGDFNIGNILLDESGKVNLIDFQWMNKTEPKRFFEDKPRIVLPPFIINENSQMFEMASLPFYMKNIQKGKAFLQEYLSAKSVYHENRAEYLRSVISNWPYKYEKDIILKGINYEDAQSVLFRHPDKDILKLETKKMQFLSNFREAFSRQDGNNPESNFVTGASSHLLTLSALQELRTEIALQKKQKYISSAKKDYLTFTDEYARYWFDNIKNWTKSIFDENINHAINIESNAGKNYDNFGRMINLYDIIDAKYKMPYSDSFDLKTYTDGTLILEDIFSGFKNLKSQTFFLFDIRIRNKQNEIKKVNERLKSAFNKDWGLDVLNLSVLNIIKNRELKKIVVAKPNLKNRDDIITELHDERLMYEKLARQSFRRILSAISSDTPSNNKLTGYENMFNFE